MIRRLHAFGAALATLAVLSSGSPAAGQDGREQWDPARLHMTRDGLEELLARFEQATRSAAYSEELRARARFEAGLIRARLEEGDFQVGDQIQLTVEREEPLSSTFTVAAGRVLLLPVIGEIPLRGVLRSELEDHLTRQISRMIHGPVVRARSLLRISILGEVASPGYYVLASEAPLTEALMAAGGPTREAKLQEIRIERGGERIWAGQPLQDAIIEGRTLDQLSLRAGDQLWIPRQQAGNAWNVIRIGLVTIPSIIYALTRIL